MSNDESPPPTECPHLNSGDLPRGNNSSAPLLARSPAAFISRSEMSTEGT